MSWRRSHQRWQWNWRRSKYEEKAEGDDGFYGHSERFGSMGRHNLRNQPRPLSEKEGDGELERKRKRERLLEGERARAVVACLRVR